MANIDLYQFRSIRADNYDTSLGKKQRMDPVMFYINEHKHEQIIGTSTKTVGVDTLDGIFMPQVASRLSGVFLQRNDTKILH